MPPVNKALVRSCRLDTESVTKLKALASEYYQLHKCWCFNFPCDALLVLKGLMNYGRQRAISEFSYNSCNFNEC